MIIYPPLVPPQMDESGACVASSTHVLEGVDLAFIHDLAVTENYYVLVLGSVKVWGGGSFWHWLDWIIKTVYDRHRHEVNESTVSCPHCPLCIVALQLDLTRFATEYLIGRCSVAQCLRFSKEVPSRVVLYPRPAAPTAVGAATRGNLRTSSGGAGVSSPARSVAPAGRKVVSAVTPKPFFSFHHVNAYEDVSGQVRVCQQCRNVLQS